MRKKTTVQESHDGFPSDLVQPWGTVPDNVVWPTAEDGRTLSYVGYSSERDRAYFNEREKYGRRTRILSTALESRETIVQSGILYN